jgi:hypothetical protein
MNGVRITRTRNTVSGNDVSGGRQGIRVHDAQPGATGNSVEPDAPDISDALARLHTAVPMVSPKRRKRSNPRKAA